MTALQIISSLFGIIIYPYVIRTLGAESYGLYVFSLSTTTYFIGFISFGFNMPAIKEIVNNKDDLTAKSKTVSAIFTAKIYLGILSTLVFTILLFTIPIIKTNKFIFILSFCQIIGEIMLPVWYFQGIQKMKIVTYIQLGFRIASLPFIYFFIKSSNDCIIYVFINSATVIAGGFMSNWYMITRDKIRIRIIPINALKTHFNNAIPFFWSSSTATIKQESVTIIIGTFFGMRDVAFYDLANKIIILPKMLTTNINGALFPKILEKTDQTIIKKIVRYETMLGLGVITVIALTGYWLILLFGGYAMLPAYPLAIIMSGSMLVWLIVGSYINFIFVPQNKYYFVTQNQFIAFASFIVLSLVGIFIFNHITAVVAALTISGFCEIVFCNYLIKKHRLL